MKNLKQATHRLKLRFQRARNLKKWVYRVNHILFTYQLPQEFLNELDTFAQLLDDDNLPATKAWAMDFEKRVRVWAMK